jgi:hypothetical protein
MIDLALDTTTNDLLITGFDLSFVDNIEQIAQTLNIRMRFFLAEWYLDTLAGIPYYQYIFIKNPNQIQVDSFLQNEISSTVGVTDITSYSSAYDGASREYSVTFSASTISGNLEMEIALP